MIDAEAMGRFFVECQALLNERLIALEAIARLRNALYGPSVAPLDPYVYRDHLHLLTEWRTREASEES